MSQIECHSMVTLVRTSMLLAKGEINLEWNRLIIPDFEFIVEITSWAFWHEKLCHS